MKAKSGWTPPTFNEELYRRVWKALKEGEERFMDIYRPEDPSSQLLPTIVWFHGGAWKIGNRKAIERVALQQVEHGFALVSVSYSLSDVAKWPVQCHEAKAAK